VESGSHVSVDTTRHGPAVRKKGRTVTATDLGSGESLRGREESRARGVGAETRRRSVCLADGSGLLSCLTLAPRLATGALLQGLGGSVAASESRRRLDGAGRLLATGDETCTASVSASACCNHTKMGVRAREKERVETRRSRRKIEASAVEEERDSPASVEVAALTGAKARAARARETRQDLNEGIAASRVE
jgi:hypothetical protein